MSAAETGFVELPDTCSVAEALQKYSRHKAWSTRYTNTVSKSQPLLDKAYELLTDEIVSGNIRKAESEVAELEVEVTAAWDRYTTNIHARGAGANAPASPAARRPLPQLTLIQ